MLPYPLAYSLVLLNPVQLPAPRFILRRSQLRILFQAPQHQALYSRALFCPPRCLEVRQPCRQPIQAQLFLLQARALRSHPLNLNPRRVLLCTLSRQLPLYILILCNQVQLLVLPFIPLWQPLPAPFRVGWLQVAYIRALWHHHLNILPN